MFQIKKGRRNGVHRVTSYVLLFYVTVWYRRTSLYDTISMSLFYLEQMVVLTCLPSFFCVQVGAKRRETTNFICAGVSKLPEVTLKAHDQSILP